MILILIVILLWPIVVGVGLLELNARNMIPGTPNYKRDQIARESLLNVERARVAAIESRYRHKEDEFITQRLLEAAK